MRHPDSAPQDDSDVRSLPPLRDLLRRWRDWLRWQGATRVVLAAITTAVVAAFGWWMVKAPPPVVDSAIPRVSTTLSSTTAPNAEIHSLTSSTITVHVVGAVRKPGVYTLTTPARVVDGVRAAGGASATANLEIINLAREVRDGEQ